MPTVIIPPTDVSPYTGTGDQVLATNPVFPGNLTVSGTGGITSSSTSPLFKATTSTLGAVPKLTLEHTAIAAWNLYLSGTDGGDFKIDQDSTNKFRMALGTGNVTLAGNLTVSGGTIGTAASTNLTLNGGSSGASLVLGQGTTGDATFSNSANTGFIVGANNATSGTGAFSALGLLAGTRQSFIYRFSEGYSSSGYYVAGALVFENNGTAGHMIFADAGSESMRITATTRNLLIGTTTDGGQKLQVAGTAYISSTTTIAGDVSINRGASDTYFSLVTSGTTAAQNILFEDSGGASGSIAYTHSTNALAFKTNGSNALTLDSSQRCILAGALRLNNAYTAGAPTATGYVTLQDSAGNTYKVLVGT